MKKRLLSMLLAVCLLVGMFPLAASAAGETSGTCGDSLAWNYDESTKTLTISGTGAMTDWDRSKNESAPWGAYPNNYNNDTEKLVIENGVTTIGNSAFRHFRRLKNCSLPSTLTRIGEYAFEDAFEQGEWDSSIGGYPGTVSLELPDGVKTIGKSAFQGSNLKSVTIPEGVTEIEPYTFGSYYWSIPALESISLPSTLTTINACAFKHCKRLSVTIPKSVSNIGEQAFYAVKSVSVVPDNTTFHMENGALCSSSKIYYCPSDCTNYEIPQGITEIGECVFAGNHNLTSVSIPEGVTTICYSAFDSCDKLASVTLPSTLQSLGSAAFEGCSSIKTVNIPDSLTEFDAPWKDPAYEGSAGDGTSYPAFASCASLERFTGAVNSNSFTINNGILYSKDETILHWYPANHPNSTLSISKAITKITSPALEQCRNLSEINVDSQNTNFYSQDGLLYQTKMFGSNEDGLVRCPPKKQGEVTLSTTLSSIRDIGTGAFSQCSQITSITLPENCDLNSLQYSLRELTDCAALISLNVSESDTSYKTIDGAIYSKNGSELFFCPGGKTEFTIADGTTVINEYAFRSSKNQNYVIVPQSVTTIPDSYSNKKVLGESQNCGKVILYGAEGSSAETYAERYSNYYTFRAGTPDDWKLEPDWNKVTVRESVPHFTSYADTVTLPNSGTATDGTTTVSGRFAVVNQWDNSEFSTEDMESHIIEDVGVKNVTIRFIVTTQGEYYNQEFEKTYTVNVVPASLTGARVEPIKPVAYTGTPQTPEVKAFAKIGENQYIEITEDDCTVDYNNNTNAGTATVTITGKGNYTGTCNTTFTITKAAITGYQTAAPTATILANNSNNAAANLKTAANLPANVTVTYKDGTASLPITWANATEKFDAKGGTYTFKGTVTPGTNFNAYSTPLTATLTVTPVTGTLAAALPASVVVAQSQAASAAGYTDFKLPSSITINCDNGVAAQTITPEWSVPLNTLKTKRAGSKTTVKVTNVPAWLTIGELSLEVQVTDKFPVNVTVTQANGTYGTELAAPVAAQSADGNGTDPNGTFTYKYTGKTAAGKTYNSNEKPTEAGSYTVTAALVSDTHAGSGSANFTINTKNITADMIDPITEEIIYSGMTQYFPPVTVRDGNTVLTEETDYHVNYFAGGNNIVSAGTHRITVFGRGNYSGQADSSFTILPRDISGMNIANLFGTPEVDQALVAGFSTPPADMVLHDIVYNWYVDGTKIENPSNVPYLILTDVYEGKKIQVSLSSSSSDFTGTSALSDAVTIAAATEEIVSTEVPGKPEIQCSTGNRHITVTCTAQSEKPVCLYECHEQGTNGIDIVSYHLDSPFTLGGMNNGEAYQISVYAYNVNGKSVVSDTVSATPKAPAPIGGGGSSTPTTPEPVITENPDGSTTTTETTEDGTTTATTTWDDGKQAVAVKSPEGKKTITVTTAAGEKVADVKLPAQPAEPKVFEDVKDDGWYKDAVDKATGYGLFNGTSDTKFSPSDGMTRGMLATVLYNLSGKPEYGTDAGAFSDVETGKWYEDPVDWAYKVGVTSGTSDTEFSPDKDITREQLVTMLYRYAEKIGAASNSRKTINGFPDGNNVAGYAQDAMQWAVAEGFISGRANGNKNYIAPQGTASRAEVAAVLTRFVEYLKK